MFKNLKSFQSFLSICLSITLAIVTSAIVVQATSSLTTDLNVDGVATIGSNLTVSGTGNTTIVGNVGIGITSPAAKLHIKDGQTWGSDLSIDAGGTTGGRRWSLISTGGTASEGQGKFLIKDNNANAARMAIDANGTSTFSGNVAVSGKVGIGTTSPGAKLEVVGNIKADGIKLGSSNTLYNLNTDYSLYNCDGTVRAVPSNVILGSYGGAVCVMLGYTVNKNYLY